MNSDNSSIKKIAPYPIHADIIKAEGQPLFKADIVKLTDFGFLAKVDVTHFYKVGENYEVRFVLPVSLQSISSAVKIIKTYDAIESIVGTEKIKMYTVEMHFTNISDSHKKQILNFLVKIGQTK